MIPEENKDDAIQPDDDEQDDLAESEDDLYDHTYFCSECGHEQFEGDQCEACGSDDWEFVRLDEEGLRRLTEARGESWEGGDGLDAVVRRPAPLLTDALRTGLQSILDDLTDALPDEDEGAYTAQDALGEWLATNREWVVKDVLESAGRETETATDGEEDDAPTEDDET